MPTKMTQQYTFLKWIALAARLIEWQFSLSSENKLLQFSNALQLLYATSFPFKRRGIMAIRFIEISQGFHHSPRNFHNKTAFLCVWVKRHEWKQPFFFHLSTSICLRPHARNKSIRAKNGFNESVSIWIKIEELVKPCATNALRVENNCKTWKFLWGRYVAGPNKT